MPADGETGPGAAPARLGGIQTLRALAAILVFLVHLQAYEALAAGDPLLPRQFILGAAGVDLFFVISGFVMVFVSRGGFGAPRPASVFLYNRAARIYPPVWLFTALAVAGYALRGDLGEQVSGGGYDVLASFLLLPRDGTPLLPVAWTLVHEMYFYAVFALLMLAPGRALPWGLAGWAGLVVAGSLAGLGGEPWSRLALSPLTLEFIAGCAAGMLVCSGRRVAPVLPLCAGAALFAAGLAVMAPYGEAGFEAWRRMLLFGPGAAFLVYGVACLEIDRGWRAPGWAAALGDWSYALYLSHMLVLAALAAGWAAIASPETLLDNLAWIAGAPAIAIGVAALTYRLFERPVLRALTRRGARERPEVAGRLW